MPSATSDRSLRVLRVIAAAALLFVVGASFWPRVIDDMFIVMTYADTWLRTGEIAWSTGERVEGFSSPLHLALLTMFTAAGADAVIAAKVVSLGSALAWIATWSRECAPDFRSTVLLLAVVCWHPFHYWSFIGLETLLFAWLLAVGWSLIVGGSWSAGMTWLAVAALARPEGVAFLAVAAAARLRDGAPAGRDDAAGIASIGAFLTFTIAKSLYFGHWLSTPFVTKILGRVNDGSSGVETLVVESVALAVLGAVAVLVGGPARRDVPLVLAPLAIEAAMLLAAHGDWMAHGRFLVPGVLASALAWGRADPGAVARWRLGAAAALAPMAMWTYSTNQGGDIEVRPPSELADFDALVHGVDTPISLELAFVVEEVPDGDRAYTSAVGILGLVPGPQIVDAIGLVHRASTEADPPETVDDVFALADADGADFVHLGLRRGEAVPERAGWTLRRRDVADPVVTLWLARHDRRPDQATVLARWIALAERFPSQPWLCRKLVLALAESGEIERAAERDARCATRFAMPLFGAGAPGASFTAAPDTTWYVADRGFGLYWNATATSRPVRPEEDLHLAVDVDGPGSDGARATVRWTNRCGEVRDEIVVHAPARFESRFPACDGPGRVSVEFLNDTTHPEDRNLYVRLEP